MVTFLTELRLWLRLAGREPPVTVSVWLLGDSFLALLAGRDFLESVSVLHLSVCWGELNFLLIFSVAHLGMVMTSVWMFLARDVLSSVLH